MLHPFRRQEKDPGALAGPSPVVPTQTGVPAHLRSANASRDRDEILASGVADESSTEEQVRGSGLDGEARDARARNVPVGVKASRIGPFTLVALACAFGLVTLRSARLPVIFPNDESVHSLMVTYAMHQFQNGHFPLDGWFPYLSLGSPFLMHYQSSPAIITGLIALVVGAQHAFGWSLYLLLALWPLSVYWGARLLSWDRWTSASAAAMSPLLSSIAGYGFGHEAYLWLGNGIWSQLWGMWVLPLAWGLSWRAISQRKYIFPAMISLGLTIAFHFLTAYLAGLTVILWVLLRPTQFVRRIKFAALISIGAVMATLWVTLPLVIYGRWNAANEFEVGTIYDNSYGARQVLSWLVRGQLFDDPFTGSRLPVITIFAAVGLVVCIFRFRRDERARALVAVWVMSLLLYFGRPTLGPIINLLPGNDQLLLHRYVMGVQLGGLFLAGVGMTWVAHLLTLATKRYRPALMQRLPTKRTAVAALSLVAIAIIVVVLFPAWDDTGHYDYANAASISAQQIDDTVEGAQLQVLTNLVKQYNNGRVYAGLYSNWGHSFTVGQVPVCVYLTNIGIDAVGFSLRTSSLMTDPEAYFNETNLGDYEALGIHYLILPAGHAPSVPATLIEQSGPFLLWKVGLPGLIQVVDSTAPITANESDLGSQTRFFLQSDLPGEGIYPTIAFDGGQAAAPTLSPTAHFSTRAGSVIAEKDDLGEGEVHATVVANRTAVVLLKSSFDPGWTVTVDGIPAKTEMLAPALVGVTVGPGRHIVVFQYQAYPDYPLLFAIALLTLLGFGLGPYLWRRFRSR